MDSILKQQIEELKKLIELKDKVIAELEKLAKAPKEIHHYHNNYYPQWPYNTWIISGSTTTIGLPGTNTQQCANQNTFTLDAL